MIAYIVGYAVPLSNMEYKNHCHYHGIFEIAA